MIDEPVFEEEYVDDEDNLGVIGFDTVIDDDLVDVDRGWLDQTEGLDWQDNQTTQGTPHVDYDQLQQAIDRLGDARSLIADEAVATVNRLRQWYGAKDHQLDINLAEVESSILVMAQALSNPVGLVFQALRQMDFAHQRELLDLLERAMDEFKREQR